MIRHNINTFKIYNNFFFFLMRQEVKRKNDANGKELSKLFQAVQLLVRSLTQ